MSCLQGILALLPTWFRDPVDAKVYSCIHESSKVCSLAVMASIRCGSAVGVPEEIAMMQPMCTYFVCIFFGVKSRGSNSKAATVPRSAEACHFHSCRVLVLCIDNNVFVALLQIRFLQNCHFGQIERKL